MIEVFSNCNFSVFLEGHSRVRTPTSCLVKQGTPPPHPESSTVHVGEFSFWICSHTDFYPFWNWSYFQKFPLPAEFSRKFEEILSELENIFWNFRRLRKFRGNWGNSFWTWNYFLKFLPPAEFSRKFCGYSSEISAEFPQKYRRRRKIVNWDRKIVQKYRI